MLKNYQYAIVLGLIDLAILKFLNYPDYNY